MRKTTLSEIRDSIDTVGRGRVECLCNVHRTTVARWLRGAVQPPESVLATLRAAAWGQRPGYDKAWDGWIFRDGLLWSPENEAFDSGEIRALVYLRPLVKSQREHIVDLERKLIEATKVAARNDEAANDLAIWPQDIRSKAFEK